VLRFYLVKMNKKANLFSVFLIGVVLFMVGMITVGFFKTPIDQARIDLDCDNVGALTDGTKVQCLFVDSAIIYFIITLISISGGVILDRFI
jgi:hypothetical protein